MTPTRPVIRYHGGKWRLAPWIVSLLPPHRICVEPFCGAASVLMRKKRSWAEIVGDLDDRVVNPLRVLRDKSMADELARLLALTPFSETEFRCSKESSDDMVEEARRTLVRAFILACGHHTAFTATCRRWHKWKEENPDG